MSSRTESNYAFRPFLIRTATLIGSFTFCFTGLGATWLTETNVQGYLAFYAYPPPSSTKLEINVQPATEGFVYDMRLWASSASQENAGSVVATYVSSYGEFGNRPKPSTVFANIYVTARTQVVIPDGTLVHYALIGKNSLFALSDGTVFYGSTDIRSRSGSFLSSGGAASVGLIQGGLYAQYLHKSFGAITPQYSGLGLAQLSLLGPIGSQASPMMVRSIDSLAEVPDSENESDSDQAIRAVETCGYQLTGSGLGIDDLLWTSSNPADLLPDADAAARRFSVNPLELELVYSVTGPRVTSLLFDSAVAGIIPNLLLEINGAEISVSLGEEIDLTQYDSLGLDRFNLRISGIDDWSILPDDWFLTGYRFSGAGEVLVTTRAVPEINVLSLSAIILVLFVSSQYIRRVNRVRAKSNL